MFDLEKALTAVKQGTAKALSNKNNDKYNASVGNFNTNKNDDGDTSLDDNHKRRYNPYNAKYQSLVKRGFKYSTNVLAKYVYKGIMIHENPNRRIKKLLMRPHNRLVLSHLSSDDRWDLPCVSYHGTRYYYVNALQFVYLIARSHHGTAIGLRKALAEVAMSIIEGDVSPSDVIRYARQHRGGKRA